eukprot:CAMPEP_0171610832 /NCGR_PEP_ID=MMETSP0990-20121206/10280_1 /TAXON_ID=483369 /ORGANISM="non described non described, Strain CCMP2098" /LENGTH=67 /DNA_ID=CAMNT_0012174309 /DNA_START=782 /DNA_END=982 /DNA_ORIENTATION=-
MGVLACLFCVTHATWCGTSSTDSSHAATSSCPAQVPTEGGEEHARVSVVAQRVHVLRGPRHVKPPRH